MKTTKKSDNEEVITNGSTNQEAPKSSTAKKALKKETKTKETKKAMKKTTKKAANKAAKKAKKVYEIVLGHVLGRYRLSSHKGKIAAEAQSKGSISEQAAQKIAGKGVDAKNILYRIRRTGKRTGWWNFFPSQKVEGKWILKVTSQAAARATKAKPVTEKKAA